jgi:hypothetical protein
LLRYLYEVSLLFAGWPHRLVVRTSASHAGNRGSNPLGVALWALANAWALFFRRTAPLAPSLFFFPPRSQSHAGRLLRSNRESDAASRATSNLSRLIKSSFQSSQRMAATIELRDHHAPLAVGRPAALSVECS